MTETPTPTLPSALHLSLLLVPNVLLAVLTFAPTAVLLIAGIGATAVWVGLLVLLLVATWIRTVARLQRRFVGAMTGVVIESPYRPFRGRNVFTRGRDRGADPATWRDLAYIALNVPASILLLGVCVAAWGWPALYATLPIWGPPSMAPSGTWLPLFDPGDSGFTTFLISIPYAAAAIVVLYTVNRLLPWVGIGYGLFARSLLGPTKASRLRRETERLQASRARGVDAAEAERRRIERDLHDGAQQRLVSVAMGLGRAKSKLEHDPDAARGLLDEAHSDAKLAISELRDLARGIYPAVLGDRGLDAALSSLAAKCPVPVSVEVTEDVVADPRPPAAVETIAYFTVAEALTNVAKYASAESAAVRVTRDGDRVTVEVTDDGVGGAGVTAGGGLAGLADRAATIDGTLTVLSPRGGPTIVRADLPCVW